MYSQSGVSNTLDAGLTNNFEDDHPSRQPTELAWQIPTACIQCWDTPDDEQWTCPKHVEYFIK